MTNASSDRPFWLDDHVTMPGEAPRAATVAPAEPPPPPAPLDPAPASQPLFTPPPPPGAVQAPAAPAAPVAHAPMPSPAPTPAPAPARAPAPWAAAPSAPRVKANWWESTLLPVGALFLIGLIALGVFGFQHVQTPDNPAPVVPAAKMQLSYKAAQVHRFAVSQRLSALLVLPDGTQARAYSDLQAVEDFRVISVAKDGTATIGLRYEQMSGQFDGIPVAFNPAKAKEMVVVISPDGKIVSGGADSTIGGDAKTQDPGGDIFSSILPSHDVRVGDAWNKSFQRPNPMGSGNMTYSTDSTLVRLDGMNGQQAAVVQSDYTLPIDMLLNMRQLEQADGGDGLDVPAGAAVTYVGSSTGRIISYVGLDSRQLLHAVGTSDFQFDMTFGGLPAGANYQDFAGKFHFGGHLETTLQSLGASSSTSA